MVYISKKATCLKNMSATRGRIVVASGEVLDMRTCISGIGNVTFDYATDPPEKDPLTSTPSPVSHTSTSDTVPFPYTSATLENHGTVTVTTTFSDCGNVYIKYPKSEE